MSKIYQNKYIILLCWVGFFLSINNPIQKGSFYINNFLEFVNVVRMLAPIFILFFIIIFFSNVKIYKQIIFNKYALSMALIFLIQIISYLIYSKTNIDFIYYPAASLIFLLFLTLIHSGKNISTLEYALHILILLLMINCSIVIFYVVKELYYDVSLNSISYSYYNSLILDPASRFYGKAAPRSTGIARQLLLINIFYFFYSNTIKNINYKLFAFLIIFISSYFIIAFQSRTSLYFLFLFYTFFLFLFTKYQFKKKLLYFSIFLLLPYAFSTYEKSIKNEIILAKIYNQQVINSQLSDQQVINSQLSDQQVINSQPSDSHFAKAQNEHSHAGSRIFNKTSSGRTYLWREALQFAKQRPFFGYGPQADRHLLNENVSNVFLYTLLCAGGLGLLILISLIAALFFNIFRLVANYRIFKYNSPAAVETSVVFLIYFLLRGLVENVFSVYSLDFIVFCISFTIINNYLFRMIK